MKKNIVIFLLGTLTLSAQVGINTTTPNSTLAVNGSLRTGYTEVTTTSYNILDNDYYITYNGKESATFTLPSIRSGTENFTGRIYKIKNISPNTITLQASNGNTLRGNSTPVKTLEIPTGAYAEVVNNNNTSGGTWDVFLSCTQQADNVDLYGTTLLIPPHGFSMSQVHDWDNHKNTKYDSGGANDRWWVISKRSVLRTHNASFSMASRMTLVYEYQGKPFNLDNLCPILTVGNNSTSSDILSAGFIKIANDGTNGKTRLTVSVARIDFVGAEGNRTSDWAGSFMMNVLLAKKR